jgi:hypothetical protein
VAEKLLVNATAQADASVAPDGALRAVSQVEFEERFVQYITRHRPARADLLELSTATILPIIRSLCSAGTRVRILVAHPDSLMTTPFMVERLHFGLANLFSAIEGTRTFEVRSYAVPPSLRGRWVDPLLALGWYTYRDNKRIDQSEGSTTEIWGHDNALVIGDVTSPDGAALADWFRREFDRLWTHRLTRDASVLRDR